MIDRNLDHSRLNGTRREDNINDQVKELERALDELRREFNRRDTFMETRREVQEVMREADEINALMRRVRFGANVEREWALVRSDLNKLAGVYELRLLK
jgi:DNA repair exonuclease SbcCD ATPase subunit